MEVGARQNLRDDRMSDCRSFGSNYHPSSQSRKISIGVMIDSSSKRKPGSTKEDEIAVQNAEMFNSNIENSVEANNKGGGTTAAIRGKQTEAPEQVRSPWITTRSFNQKAPTLETVLCTKQTSNSPGTSGRQRKLNGVKHTPVTYSVQFFANQTTILQSSDDKQKKVDGTTYKRKGGNDGNPERVEEFTFAAAQEVLVSNKAVMEDKAEKTDKADKTENRSTEALRTKLWEILETVSSPKSQHINSQVHEVGANDCKLDQIVDQKGDKLVKPRQNSDTIETDSESLDHAIRRPVTRSLTRKRAPTKLQQRKTIFGSSSSYKQRHQEKSILSFEEGWPGKLNGAVNCGSSVSERKKRQRKNSVIEPLKILFSEKDDADKTQRENYRSEIPPHAQKTYSFGNNMGYFNGFPPENMGDFQEPQNTILEKDSHQSPDKTNQLDDFDSPALPENGDQQEDLDNPYLKNVLDLQDDLWSPTFGIKTPVLSPFPHSIPETVWVEQSDRSPAREERRFTVGNIRRFKTLGTSKPACCGPNAQRDSSDDSGKLKDYSPRKETPVKLKEGADEGLYESSSEETDSGSSEDDSAIIKGYQCRRERETSLENGTAEKSKFMLRQNKMVCNPEAVGVNELSPTSPSPNGVHESDYFQEPSEQNQEDGLGRAVTLFALALKNFEMKLKSAARKKSSEILMSVSEGIHLQLQGLETQIQTDVGRLTSLGKSKRKHLETRFQEQQERLRIIHENFKGEINHFLQDCRSTLEGLEAHQTELKGTVKKQRASHQKLLLQVDEAIETELSNAQRRITAVNELAKGKMFQLKRVVAECLKEDILI